MVVVGGEGRGGEGTVLVMRWFSKRRTSFFGSGVGGGFVGDLLEGRKKAETRLIRGRGGGGLGLGGGAHRCTFLTVRGDTG